MNTKDTRKVVEQAYADGFEVEMRHRNTDNWFLRGPWRHSPEKWKWEEYEYRIKAPKTKDSQAQYPEQRKEKNDA